MLAEGHGHFDFASLSDLGGGPQTFILSNAEGTQTTRTEVFWV